MTEAQLDALDRGFTFGLLWLAGVVILLATVASLIGYTAQQVGQAQEATKTLDVQPPTALRKDLPAPPDRATDGPCCGEAPSPTRHAASRTETRY
jgi:hypothetical protein